jgi:F-type H+-transporting ATPase subunit b
VKTLRRTACEFMHRVMSPAALLVLLVALTSVVHAAEEGGHHEASLADLLWPTANFAIMVAVLVYLLRVPLTTYLADRSTGIRKDLVDAATLKASATAQLSEIDQKMRALPGELASLRARAEAEIQAEEQRIAQQAVADRDRLVEQARKQMDVQVRMARRELTEHAANLAVDLATRTVEHDTTADDHARLVDRYVSQVSR